MKKLLALLLLLATPAVSAYAAQMTVTAPEKSELSDGRYSVTAELTDNPGFVSVQLELFYDPDVLTCREVAPGELTAGMMTDSNPAAKRGGAHAVFSAAGAEATEGDGVLATFVFDEPQSGDPAFRFSLAELRADDGTPVECEVILRNEYGESLEPSGGSEDSGGAGGSGGTSGSGNAGNSGSGGNQGGSGGRRAPGFGTIPPPTVESGEQEPESVALAFSDVPESHWARETVSEAAALGLVSGYPDGRFLPEHFMTRAEFVTVLWNLQDKPAPERESSFADVTEGQWFYAPVVWCAERGYVNGVSERTFAPEGNITREQAVTILYRFAGSPQTAETVPDRFADADDVSGYARAAVCWATENGILSGGDDGRLAPGENATRAQLAAMTLRMTKTALS